MSHSVHPVDERLPIARLVPLAIQHVLVMYAGAVAVPLIIGRAVNLPPDGGFVILNIFFNGLGSVEAARSDAAAVAASAEHV